MELNEEEKMCNREPCRGNRKGKCLTITIRKKIRSKPIKRRQKYDERHREKWEIKRKNRKKIKIKID